MTGARTWPSPDDRDACLDCLAEMAGVAVMAVARARRHGLDTAAPGIDADDGTNLDALRTALADVRRAADLLGEATDGAAKSGKGTRTIAGAAVEALKAIAPHPEAARLRAAGVSPVQQAAWFRDVTFRIDEGDLVIRAGSQFVAAEIRAQWEWHLRRAWGATHVRYEVTGPVAPQPEGKP